jgi:TonB-linked SusC/RagA family outer membrane protein
MMRRKAFVSLVVALLAGGPLAAQAGRIMGTVTSADGGRPLAGAVVTVSGTSARAVTGPAGRYTLNDVAPGTHQVTAAMLGHSSQTLSVTVGAGAAATLDFQLHPATIALQGVVAIGYGEQRQRAATGSVQAVDSSQFNTGRVVSPEQLITGKVAGVQVIDSNEPGGGISMRIRGATSVKASNEPLFVVDGVPLAVGGGLSAAPRDTTTAGEATRSPLAFLNPNDIESITVLKDAASTAIYGSRGANGVVIIKTKGGSSGTQFSYGTSVSTSRVTGGPDLLSADQFRAAVQAHAPTKTSMLGAASTNWRDQVIRSAPGQEHELAVSGAGSDMAYRLSLGYLDQQGVLRGSATKRISGAVNYNQRLFQNHLNLRANFKGSRTDDRFTPGGVIGEATAFAPTQPVTASSGYFEWANQLATNNPIAELTQTSDKGTTYRSVGNVETQYRFPFLEALAATVRFGYDVTRAERTIFKPSTLKSQVFSAYPGSLERRSPSQSNSVLDAFFNYARGLDRWDSNVDLTAGYSYEMQNNEFPGFTASGLSSDLLGPNGVPAAEKVSSSLDIQQSRLASAFARFNYSYKDRYLLSASVRRDGSSKFGPNNQWGTFPSVGLGWRIIDEPFMQSFGHFSDLKLRGSWGINGNQSFDNYLYESTYRIGGAEAQAQFGDTWVTTIRPSAVDPNLKWEQTTSWDAGLDWGVLDGRVSGTLDYYVKNTSDLIFTVPVAGGTNLSNYVTTNIGSMRNRGFELGVDAQVLRGRNRGFSWDASFNASTNRNRLLSIYGGSGGTKIVTGGISGGVGNNVEVLQPGFPINSFFVYRTKRDSNGKPAIADTNHDGRIDEHDDLYVDQNGDGSIDQNDLVAYHSPQPRWILGHTSRFGYRSVDLSLTMRAYLGNYVYNNVASNFGNYDALRGAAPNNLHTSVLTYNYDQPQYFSDVYVENASFVRMDNLTLGYTVPRLRSLKSARIFGTVQNVFTTTKYGGVDPTAGINGIDNNLYPRSRTFTAGVNIGF